VTNNDVARIYRLALENPYGTGEGTALAGLGEQLPFDDFLLALERGDSTFVRTGASSLPKAFGLRQNYPNPFNPSTTISYTVPEGSHQVMLEVFDIRGRLVRVLADREQPQGSYSVVWDGTNESGARVASGVYFSRMRSGGFSAVRKMVLIK
jgi:hypothetical protein